MSQFKTVLIDGDVYAYRCAISAEGEPQQAAFSRMEEMLHNTYLALRCSFSYIFVSGENNFRYDIYPEYKANRKGKPDPKWLQDCREYLVTHFKAEITDGYEADDAMGIANTIFPQGSAVIATVDKDLQQVA